MRSWNVVVSIRNRAFIPACKLLEELGPVGRTDFYNVLVMKVGDVNEFLQALRKKLEDDPHILTLLSHVIPVTDSFNFQTVDEFQERAREQILGLVPELSEKSFHVRVHRRGFKGRLSSQDVQHYLTGVLVEALEKKGESAHIDFEDPDVIIAVETVGGRAGLSLWNREDLKRYPFIRLD